MLKRKKSQCPRCLGKGHVDQDDIVRLNRTLVWGTGTCAYCNGKGIVSQKMIDRVPADLMYLVLQLDRSEVSRLIRRDQYAWARAKYFEDSIELFINQIQFLHFRGGMNFEMIMEYLKLDPKNNVESETEDLEAFVRRIIESEASLN